MGDLWVLTKWVIVKCVGYVKNYERKCETTFGTRKLWNKEIIVVLCETLSIFCNSNFRPD